MSLTQQQCDDLDSRASIELVSVNLLVKEPTLFNATMQRALRHVGAGNKVTISGSERDRHGWLEFGMRIEYAGGAKLFIGCIQRAPGAECEFHS